MSGGFLEEMAQGSRARVNRARAALPEAALLGQLRGSPLPPPLRLDARGFDLIAELKLRSPSAGVLAGTAMDVAAQVGAYARAGAAAVSVLTETTRFDGSLAHLAVAASALAAQQVPVMRKDFLVDPYQVLEARAAGAGGVLLIVRMLSAAQLDALVDCAAAQRLFVLLEAFDEDDLERMYAIVGAHASRLTLLAGINCRDLATLEVVPARLWELAPLLPAGVPGVAESGVATTGDCRQLAAAGYHLALIGSALMQDEDPEALARSLLEAGRASAGA